VCDVENENNIPGFDAAQAWTIRQIIREEVAPIRHEVKGAIADAMGPDRPPCDRIAKLEDAVTSKGGLIDHIGDIEKELGWVVWLSRTTLGAAIIAVVAAIFQLISKG